MGLGGAYFFFHRQILIFGYKFAKGWVIEKADTSKLNKIIIGTFVDSC